MKSLVNKFSDQILLLCLGYMTFSYFVPFPYFAQPITFAPYELSQYLGFIKGYGLRRYTTPITFALCFLIISFFRHRAKYLVVGSIFIIYYFFRHSVTHALSSFFYLFFLYMFCSFNKTYKEKGEMAWSALGISLIATGLHKINPLFLSGDSYSFNGHFFNLTQPALKEFILYFSKYKLLPYFIVAGEIFIGLLFLLRIRFAVILLTLSTIFFSLFYGRIILVQFFFLPLFLCLDKKIFLLISRHLSYCFKYKVIGLLGILGIFSLRLISPMYFFFSMPLIVFILFFHPKPFRFMKKIDFKQSVQWPPTHLKNSFTLLVILLFACSFIFKLPEPYGLSMFSSKDKIYNKAYLIAKDPAFCTMYQRLFNPGYAWASNIEFMSSNISSGCKITTTSKPTLEFIKQNTCRFLIACPDSDFTK